MLIQLNNVAPNFILTGHEANFTLIDDVLHLNFPETPPGAGYLFKTIVSLQSPIKFEFAGLLIGSAVAAPTLLDEGWILRYCLGDEEGVYSPWMTVSDFRANVNPFSERLVYLFLEFRCVSSGTDFPLAYVGITAQDSIIEPGQYGDYDYVQRPIPSHIDSFYFGFIKDFNEFSIGAIQTFLQVNARSAHFRPEGTSIIHVVEAQSLEKRLFPEIMIERTDLQVEDLFLGGKQGSLVQYGPGDTRTEIGERLGGKVKMSTSWKLGSFSSVERDLLGDLLTYALVGPIRWAFHKRGFNILPNSVTVGPEVVEQPEKLGQAIYTRAISLSVESEWWDDFFFDDVNVQDIEYQFERG